MLLGPSGLIPSRIKEKYLNNPTDMWQKTHHHLLPHFLLSLLRYISWNMVQEQQEINRHNGLKTCLLRV